jgi:YbbR domain-containing protein
MMFVRNIPLKIASLFIALVLAYGVQRASNASVVSLFVPLEIKNMPEDRIVVRPAKRGSQVTLKGPSFIVGPLASAPPPLRVKLPDGVGDRVVVTLSSRDLSLPPSVEVLGIEPSQVELFLERLERQELRVTVPRVGQLAKGLVLEGIEVSPKSIPVKGPRSELRQLKVIETEPIDLGTLDVSKDVTLNVRTVGGAVSPEVKTVVARVVIGEQPTVRTFSGIPVEVRVGGGTSIGFSVAPSRVALTVSGSPSVLASLQEQDLFPFVRTTAPSSLAGSSRQQVQIQLPLGLRVVSIEPPAVVVDFKAEAQKSAATRNKTGVLKRN